MTSTETIGQMGSLTHSPISGIEDRDSPRSETNLEILREQSNVSDPISSKDRLSETGTTKASAGSYAVSNIKTRPWLTTTVTATTTKTRKSKTQIVIVHPIFTQCANVTPDPFWTGIFQKAAIGKFPRGFTYKDGFLVHKRGSKVTRVEVPMAPAEASSACIAFFGKTSGLVSPNDQEKNRQLMDERLHDALNNQMSSWSAISKKKKLKELLITTYIDELATEHHLTYDEKLVLTSTINKGFIMGYFTSKNIQFENGRIVSIGGLMSTLTHEKSSKVTFSLDPDIKGRPKKTKKKRSTGDSIEPSDDAENMESGIITDGVSSRKKKINFLEMWEKFLDNFEKRMFVPKKLKIINSREINVESSDPRLDLGYSETPQTETQRETHEPQEISDDI